MLVTMTARLVRSHGKDEIPLPGSGRIEYRPAAHGTYQGALRGTDTVVTTITEGVAEPVELTPGPWRVMVRPDHGAAWESWLIELEPGMPEPVDLVDLAPVLVVDGEKWTVGPPGASVVGGRDNGDGTVSFELSDGTYTDPVTVPPGPAGRGIASISDPDSDSRVTITYTDGSTSTVQAIRGAQGEPGERGEPGADSTVPGPANTLAIGTVASGDTASATITGTAPSQTLNLTLPRGEQGIPGTATLSDTGWRNVTSLLGAPPTAGTVKVRRIGPFVHYWVDGLNGVSGAFLAEPSGFSIPTSGSGTQGGLLALTDPDGVVVASNRIQINRFVGKRLQFFISSVSYGRGVFVTDDAWPATLPGTPVS